MNDKNVLLNGALKPLFDKRRYERLVRMGCLKEPYDPDDYYMEDVKNG